jgi:hypothetical protein
MTGQMVKCLSVLLILLAALMGCAGQGSPTPLPTSTVVPASPTASVAVPTESATAMPATSTSASSPAPQPSPTGEARRIEFSPGMTSTALSGELALGGVVRYVLRAQAGQLMEANVLSAKVVQLSVEGEDGTIVKTAEGTPFFRGILPSSQDYFLVLTGGDEAVSYSLSVIIPERIQFAAGATSAAVEGQLSARGVHYYVLAAQAGQLMEVNVSPPNAVQTVIYGVDGTVLKSGMGGGSFFRGTLPSTQDYILSLTAGDRDVSYTMNVVIANRIEFAAGATSAVEQGNVGPGQEQAWVLAASGGQTMKVDVVAAGAAVRLVIYGEDGTVLKSGMGEASTFEGVLPSTQDYVVIVGPADRSTAYQLEVTVLPGS